MLRRALIGVGVCVLVAVPSTAAANTPPMATTDFSCTGSEQSWVVPSGVTSVDVVVVGAPGGAGAGGVGGEPGGLGAQRSGTIAVVPGQRLWIEVGCAGATPGAGGFNGGGGGGGGVDSSGGGGGGASDVRSVSRLVDGSLGTRLIVAAGGGGGGGDGGGGGVGGAGGAPGASGSGAGGAAGTLNAGGAPGGAFGVGGDGGGATFDGGGGGGGGWFGGGGGGGGAPFAGGGGGGGSSFFAPQVGAQASGSVAPADPPRVSLTYQVPTAELSATAVTFTGSQPQKTLSAPQTVSLTNTGAVPLVITGLGFEGANPQDFLLGSLGCVSQVAADATCTLSVRFAPQANGQRTATLRVTTSIGDRTIDLTGTGGELPQGATGVQGLPGPAGRDGQLVLVAYQAIGTASKATVRYALTGPADITLTVKPPKGASATVAKAKGKAGINQVTWNRKLKGRKAPKGTYRLTITATAGGKTLSSTVAVRLK